MKLISLPNNSKELLRAALLKQIDEVLGKDKSVDKSINIKADVQALIIDQYPHREKAMVQFKASAFTKLWLMVAEHTQEVAAHCLCIRDTQPGVFTIQDVLMYPQTVTAATVQATDDYGPWLMQLDDDQFNRCKMQMHSHVNMSTTPSAVDTSFYNTLLEQVKDFYIFMIMNKRGEMWFNIYDVANNILYENTDIEYDLLTDDGDSIVDWLDESNSLISKPVLVQPYSYTRTPLTQDFPNYRAYSAEELRAERELQKELAAYDREQAKDKKKPGRPPKEKPNAALNIHERELMKQFGKDKFNAIHD